MNLLTLLVSEISISVAFRLLLVLQILAFKNGKTIALQVKAWSKGSVSFDAKNYISIRFEETKQIIEGYVDCADDSLIFVFVKIATEKGNDEFFTLTGVRVVVFYENKVVPDRNRSS